MVSPTPESRHPTPSPSPRKALHQKSSSQTNVDAAIRLVPYEPALLDDERDKVYSRTPLPTSSAHVFPPSASASYRAYEGLQVFTSEEEEDGVSPPSTPAQPQEISGSGSSTPSQAPQTPQLDSRLLAARLKPPLRKLRKHVAVDPQTKTFKVLDVAQQNDNEPRSLVSPVSQLSDRFSSNTHDTEEAARSSTASWFPGSTVASTPTSIAVSNSPTATEDPLANSPWNYALVGGVRKVPKTPDIKQKSPDISDYPLPPLPESPVLRPVAVEISACSPRPPTPDLEEEEEEEEEEADDTVLHHDLSAKPSFQSALTTSSDSNYTNYKIYGDVSVSPSPLPSSVPSPSARESNYNTLSTPQAVQTSSLSTPNYQILNNSPSIPPPSSTSNYPIPDSSPTASDVALGEETLEILGDSSPSTSFVGFPSVIRPTYSQESLLVPPLKPRARRSSDNLGQRFEHRKEYSRDSFRTGSFTSLSTVLTQEASEARIASGSVVLLSRPKSSAVWVNPGQANSRTHMQTHPHVWSSQLSTVASESDTGTDRGSRSWSDARRSSGALSPVSRRIPSISSSMMLSDNHSWGDTLDAPQPAYLRFVQPRDATGSTVRIVENQDEYGDEITDMPGALRPKPSRSRISGFFSISSSDNGRTNTMRSTTSSRANSLLVSSIPAWAKVYYGSGERKYLGAPGSSTEGTDSRPQSSFRSGSPDMANFPLSIYSPRRRPRETNANATQAQSRGSMEISPMPARSEGSLIHNNYTRTRRIRTSSIWSPHLRHDRRSTRTSLWDVPSVNWSTEPGLLGRRNIQIVMFIAGFIFPIAWIVAAFLPLPPAPVSPITESKQEVEQRDGLDGMAPQFGPMDELRYESARRWRTLNRGMAVLGVLVIVAIIVLAVVGSRQGLS